MADDQPAPRTLAERLQFLYETTAPKGHRYTDRDVAARIAEQGSKISANYLWLLRTGQREKLGLAYAEMIAKFFGVPVSYFSSDDPRVDEDVQAQVALATALADSGVRAVALRAHGLSASALAVIQKMIDHARELEHLPPRPEIAGPADAASGARDNQRHDPRRWFGVGHSVLADPAAAGAQATTTALAGRSASLLLVFGSISYDLAPLLDAVRTAAGTGVTIVGCSSMGEIAARGAVDDSVVVVALGGPGFQIQTRVSRDASARGAEAGAEAAGCLDAIDRPHRTLLLLCDGLAQSHHAIVRGAYSVAGPTAPLVGGCAADNLTFTRTYQFSGDGTGVEIMSDAVVGIAIGSDAPIGVGVAHGWRRSGEAMYVTRSNEGHVHLLDDEPAVDVYLRRIGEDRSIADVGEKFREAAFHRPLALSRRDGEDIRVINGVDPSDHSLTCLADVPQDAQVWLMDTDTDSLVGAAGDSCLQAVRMLDGEAPIGLLSFNCGARKTMLGHDGTQREAAELVRVAGDTPFGGFYTYGEIARTDGPRGMHHLTVVTLALS